MKAVLFKKQVMNSVRVHIFSCIFISLSCAENLEHDEPKNILFSTSLSVTKLPVIRQTVVNAVLNFSADRALNS